MLSNLGWTVHRIVPGNVNPGITVPDGLVLGITVLGKLALELDTTGLVMTGVVTAVTELELAGRIV